MREVRAMRIILYIVGSLILLGALCYAATLIGVPPVWVGVIGAVIDGALELFLDGTEVQHHGLLVEGAVQF